MLLEVYNASSLKTFQVMDAMSQALALNKQDHHVFTPVLFASNPKYALDLRVAEYAIQLCSLDIDPQSLTVVTNYSMPMLTTLVNMDLPQIWTSSILHLYRLLHTNFGVPPAKYIAILTDETTPPERFAFIRGCLTAGLPAFVFTAQNDNIQDICTTFLNLAFEQRWEESK